MCGCLIFVWDRSYNAISKENSSHSLLQTHPELEKNTYKVRYHNIPEREIITLGQYFLASCNLYAAVKLVTVMKVI